MKQLGLGAEFEGRRHLVSESGTPVEKYQTQQNDGAGKMETFVLESKRTPEALARTFCSGRKKLSSGKWKGSKIVFLCPNTCYLRAQGENQQRSNPQYGQWGSVETCHQRKSRRKKKGGISKISVYLGANSREIGLWADTTSSLSANSVGPICKI